MKFTLRKRTSIENMGKIEMPCKNFTIKGNLYVCKFSKRGGNSIIYEPKNNTENFIIKEFFPNKDKKDNRKDRFIKEINFLKNNKDREGIVHLIDSSSTKNSLYYVMKKYQTLEEYLSTNIPFQKIITMFIEFGLTIKKLHDDGITHRDIKLQNIFVDNDRLILGDFGLLKELDSDISYTIDSQKLGPRVILPPESVRFFANDNIDYKKVDTYLFSKVLWQVITNELKCGFSGEYRRSNLNIYLDKNKIGVDNLDPLHELLEKCTYDDFNKRIYIEDAINLLRKELRFINNDEKASNDEIGRCRCIELAKKNLCNLTPSEILYEDAISINNVLPKLDVVLNANLYSKNNKTNFLNININSINLLDENEKNTCLIV